MLKFLSPRSLNEFKIVFVCVHDFQNWHYKFFIFDLWLIIFYNNIIWRWITTLHIYFTKITTQNLKRYYRNENTCCTCSRSRVNVWCHMLFLECHQELLLSMELGVNPENHWVLATNPIHPNLHRNEPEKNSTRLQKLTINNQD